MGDPAQPFAHVLGLVLLVGPPDAAAPGLKCPCPSCPIRGYSASGERHRHRKVSCPDCLYDAIGRNGIAGLLCHSATAEALAMKTCSPSVLVVSLASMSRHLDGSPQPVAPLWYVRWAWLRIRCQCGRYHEERLADVIERHGLDTQMRCYELVARLRCRACGERPRSADITQYRTG